MFDSGLYCPFRRQSTRVEIVCDTAAKLFRLWWIRQILRVHCLVRAIGCCIHCDFQFDARRAVLACVEQFEEFPLELLWFSGTNGEPFAAVSACATVLFVLSIYLIVPFYINYYLRKRYLNETEEPHRRNVQFICVSAVHSSPCSDDFSRNVWRGGNEKHHRFRWCFVYCLFFSDSAGHAALLIHAVQTRSPPGHERMSGCCA